MESEFGLRKKIIENEFGLGKFGKKNQVWENQEKKRIQLGEKIRENIFGLATLWKTNFIRDSQGKVNPVRENLCSIITWKILASHIMQGVQQKLVTNFADISRFPRPFFKNFQTTTTEIQGYFSTFLNEIQGYFRTFYHYLDVLGDLRHQNQIRNCSAIAKA